MTASSHDSQRAAASAKHLVAPLEPSHPGAGRRDRTRNVLSRGLVFRPAQPVSHEAYQVRPAGHEVPDAGVEARRVHAQQHLARTRARPVDLGNPQYIGRAVFALDDRFHGVPRRRR